MAQEQENTGVPFWLNTVMTVLLRSPLHFLVSEKTMLITFKGHKSGKTHTTPVSYLKEGNIVSLFTHSQWWKNFAEAAPVTLRIKGKKLKGTAHAVSEDNAAIATVLTRHLARNHADAKYYHVTYDDRGKPDAEKLQKAAEDIVMIQVRLD